MQGGYQGTPRLMSTDDSTAQHGHMLALMHVVSSLGLPAALACYCRSAPSVVGALTSKLKALACRTVAG
jgi:hypothetical protein